MTLLGTLDINRHDARRLLSLISSVRGQLDLYMTHRLPMDRVELAFEAQAAFECGKVVLLPWGLATGSDKPVAGWLMNGTTSKFQGGKE